MITHAEKKEKEKKRSRREQFATLLLHQKGGCPQVQKSATGKKGERNIHHLPARTAGTSMPKKKEQSQRGITIYPRRAKRMIHHSLLTARERGNDSSAPARQSPLTTR